MVYRVRLGYTDEQALAAINPQLDGRVRDEPPQQHGLHPRLLPRRRAGRAQLRGRRVGAHLAAAGADPRDGGVLRAAQLGRPALPHGAAALRADGHRGRRAAGDVPGRRPDASTAGCARPSSACSTTCSRASSPEAERDLVFIPVGINYDRVIEDRTLLRKLDARPRRAAAVAHAARHGAASSARQAAVHAAGPALPLRLRLRQLRPAGVDARPCARRTASTSAPSTDAAAPRRGRRASASALMQRDRRRSCRCCRCRWSPPCCCASRSAACRELELKAAVQELMQQRRSARRATSTCRAATATTRSTSACACSRCAAW